MRILILTLPGDPRATGHLEALAAGALAAIIGVGVVTARRVGGALRGAILRVP